MLIFLMAKQPQRTEYLAYKFLQNMKIIMLQTRYGSEDGFSVRLFRQNQEYEIAETLGAHFVRVGAAINKEKSRFPPSRE